MIEIKSEIRNSNLEYVKNYFSSGADVNSQFENGETALIMACEFQNLDMVKYLVTIGANPKIKENKGYDAEGVTFWYGEGPMGYYSPTCKAIVKVLQSASAT